MKLQDARFTRYTRFVRCPALPLLILDFLKLIFWSVTELTSRRVWDEE